MENKAMVGDMGLYDDLIAYWSGFISICSSPTAKL